MRSLYLAYSQEFDSETSTWCISGIDSQGQLFGVGAGPTLEECQTALRDYVLDVLDAHAGDGEDRFGDLTASAPAGTYVEFDPVELLPLRLKLARVNAGLRQSDMATRIGVTQQAYAKLEAIGANPTIRTLVQAERALGTEFVTLNLSGKRKRA
jgi:DNA-binding XRE family transcriptional regulator